MTVNANLNDVTSYVRSMSNNPKIDMDLAASLFEGRLHLFIFRHVLSERGLVLEEGSKENSFTIVNPNDSGYKIPITLYFSTSHYFQVVPEDVDYYIFMNLKYIFIVSTSKVQEELPESGRYHIKKVKSNCSQVIQFSNLII